MWCQILDRWRELLRNFENLRPLKLGLTLEDALVNIKLA